MKKIFERKNNEKNGSYNMFKILGIMAIFFLVLTWFIKSGYLKGGELVENANAKLGIVDFFLGGFYTFNYFLLQILLIFVIGGFYGIISKTSGYEKIVDKLSKVVKRWKVPSILIVSLIFALLASVITEVTPLIIFIPFIISVFNKAGIDKLIVFASTFGSVMLGMVGATYSSYGLEVFYSNMGADVTATRGTHILILILAYVLMNLFSILRVTNTEEKVVLLEDRYEASGENKKSSAIPIMVVVLSIVSIFFSFFLRNLITINPLLLIFLVALVLFIGFFVIYLKFNKGKENRSWPLIVILSLLLIFVILGYVNWNGMGDISIFKDFHSWLTEDIIVNTSEGKIAVFGSLLGTTSAFGEWNVYVIAIFVIIFGIAIAKSYGMSLNEIMDSFGDGMKKIAVPALLYAMAHILIVYTNWLPLVNNITYGLLNDTTKYSFILIMLVGFIGAIFSSDPAFLGHLIGAYVATKCFSSVNSGAVVLNSLYGLAQFVIPTGLLLFAGLSYCDIKYTSWLKYIWRYVVSLLIVMIIIFWRLG